MLDEATKKERRIKARFQHLCADLQVRYICKELEDPPSDDEIKAAALEMSGILSCGEPIERYTEFIEQTIREDPRECWAFRCGVVQHEMLGE